MSSLYLVYTEIKKDGIWHAADQYLQTKDKNWSLVETYANWSRTSFGNAFEKMTELGTVNPSDLSDAVRQKHPLRDRKEVEDLEYDWLIRNRVSIPLQTMQDALPGNGRKQHSGFYHKDRIAEFESGEIDDLFEQDIAPDVYAKMAPEMRLSLYSYYEWDEPWGWQEKFRILIKLATSRAEAWKEFNGYWEKNFETRIVCFCF